MLSLVNFLIITSLLFKADAQSPDNDPVEISFVLHSELLENNTYTLVCDHHDNNKQQNLFTVLEGEEFTINMKYNFYINHVNCHDYNNNTDLYLHAKKGGSKNVTTFKAEKRMGTRWNCTIFVHRDNPYLLPVVQYEDYDYTAAYCYMKIHVRQTKSPQTILVNNIVLQAVRTDLSEKDVDFTAEYQYTDGDVLNVTCVNFLNPALLTMEYAMAGTKSDNSTMKELSSYTAIGFVAKFHSGHNNSFMICTNTEPTDYTKVMVRFVMRAEFSKTTNSYTLVYILTSAGVIVILLGILYWTVKMPSCCIRLSSQELPPVPTPRPDPATGYYENRLPVFQQINDREAQELENNYEEIQ